MKLDWMQHLIILPVLLPLLSGALLILINEKRHQFKFIVNFSSLVLQLAVAVALIYLTDSGTWTEGIGVYLAANWSAPFGIALVAGKKRVP